MSARIETPRLVLREWTIEDVDDLVDGLNNIEVAKWLLTVPFPYTKKDAEDYIGKRIGLNEKFSFAIQDKQDGKVIGGIGVSIKEGSFPELGMWFNANYHGKGCGTEALRAVAKLCFDTLKVKKLSACYFEDNEISWKMQKKLGFKQTGKKGEVVCKATGEKKTNVHTVLYKEDFIP